MGSHKETNNTPLTLGLNTHTQLIRTYNMDKLLFCVFLCSHLSGLQKDAYWNKTERVPRWLMLCFGSGFEGEDCMIHSVFNTEL